MPLQLLDPNVTRIVPDVELVGAETACVDASFVLRDLDALTARDIGKRHTKERYHPRTHAKVTEQDLFAILDDVVDYCVVEWQGVVGADGQPLPCTRDYKIRGLDNARKTAIFEACGGNREFKAPEVAEAESFRGPGVVSQVVDG